MRPSSPYSQAFRLRLSDDAAIFHLPLHLLHLSQSFLPFRLSHSGVIKGHLLYQEPICSAGKYLPRRDTELFFFDDSTLHSKFNAKCIRIRIIGSELGKSESREPPQPATHVRLCYRVRFTTLRNTNLCPRCRKVAAQCRISIAAEQRKGRYLRFLADG